MEIEPRLYGSKIVLRYFLKKEELDSAQECDLKDKNIEGK